MKKGNKKLLVVAVLLLLVCVGIGTYAIYRSSATGEATVATATWAVKVNNTNIVQSDTFTFTESNINWTTNTSAVEGKIAPGSSGTITLEIDATGSEVNVDYTAAVGTIQVAGVDNANNAFTVTPHATADETGTIPYSTTTNAMKKTLTFDVTWTGDDDDNASKDASDIGMSGKNITIPITVTAKQHL